MPSKQDKGKGKAKDIKGGHNTGKSPSNKETHQKGEARRQQDQDIILSSDDHLK